METAGTEWADGDAGVCCSVNEDYTDPQKKAPKPRDPRVSTRLQGWWWGRDRTQQNKKEGGRPFVWRHHAWLHPVPATGPLGEISVEFS
jgi:hypothetical protein